MRPYERLPVHVFRKLAPLIPVEAVGEVWQAWIGGRPLEAQRIMADHGMDHVAVGVTVRSLSATLVAD